MVSVREKVVTQESHSKRHCFVTCVMCCVVACGVKFVLLICYK